LNLKAHHVLIFAMVLMAAMAPAAAKQPSVVNNHLEFTLTDLDGEPVTSSDERFEGKVVLVDLWATWCPPCLTEVPTLIELQTEYESRGLIIVAIAFEDQDQPESRRRYLQEFVEKHNINYLVLDGGSPDDFAAALPSIRDIKGLPVEILIDRNGRVVKAKNSTGYKKIWARKLKRDIEQLLE
jgi:thiol-disulfide isomerase/thioredoxin